MSRWRQEHAEPAGAGWLHQALPQDRLLGRAIDRCWAIFTSNRTPRRRPRSCSTWMRPISRCTAISRSGSSTATTTATAICRCTSSPATSSLRAAQAGQSGRGGRRGRRGGSHRNSTAAALAGGKDRAARRLRLLPRRTDGLVRKTMSITCSVWPQSAAPQAHRQTDGRGNLEQSTGKAARVFTEFDYKPTRAGRAPPRGSQGRVPRQGRKPAFVVTSLPANQWAAQQLYEKFYCARGEMENRIKEQMCLFADRLSPTK